jgi:hypothetical protein
VRPRWSAVAIVAVVIPVAALVWTTLSGQPRSPTAHPDGAGILASVGAPDGGWALGVDPWTAGRPVSFGMRLCLSEGAGPAVITSVTATAPAGHAPTFLGASLRRFPVTSDHLPAYGSEGYPPHVPDPLVDAIGATVDTPCSTPASEAYTELIIGLDPSADGGGGWLGETIGYEVGGTSYALAIDNQLLFCGQGFDHPRCDAAPPSGVDGG